MVVVMLTNYIWSVTLIDSLRRAGFTIEAWPLILNELEDYAMNSAALASSIFLIARKREVSSVGNYAMEVRPGRNCERARQNPNGRVLRVPI